MKKAARLISDIFVPPTFTLLAFILLAVSFEPTDKLRIWVGLSGLMFGFLFPIIFFVYLRKKGKVINNDATIKEERTFPYIVGIIFCLLAFLFLFSINANEFALSLWLAYAGNSIIMILINNYWKISAHAIGAATFGGLLYFLYGAIGLYFIPLLILIGLARLELKVHTPAQIIAGSLLGFLGTYYQLLIYSNLF